MIYLMYSVMGTHQVDKMYSRISLYDVQDENRVFSIYSLLDRRQEVSVPGWSPGFRLGFDFTQAPPPPAAGGHCDMLAQGKTSGDKCML
jgi:hypothetical protein